MLEYVIAAVCVLIGLLGLRYLLMSHYKGFFYFTSAYLLFGIGFVLRDHVALLSYYALSAGAFYLLYSLIWREVKGYEDDIPQFSIIIHIGLHITSIVLSILSFLTPDFPYFVYIVQVFTFLIATFIAHKKYIEHKKTTLLFYMYAMILNFVVWALQLFSIVLGVTADIIALLAFITILFIFVQNGKKT